MWTINPSQDSWSHMQKTVWESKTGFHSRQDWWISKRLLYSTDWKIILTLQLLQNTWKNHCVDVKHKSFESTPGNISTSSDYAGLFSFEPNGQLQNELFDNNRTSSMDGCYLDHFRKTFNVSNFCDNGCGYVHQSNDMVQEFHIHLSYSKLQNAATTTAHLYTLLAKMF